MSDLPTGKWDVVMHVGRRQMDEIEAVPMEENLSFLNALAAMNSWAQELDATMGYRFRASIDWAHTLEGLTADRLPVSLYLRRSPVEVAVN
jgi:hypothetical protein